MPSSWAIMMRKSTMTLQLASWKCISITPWDLVVVSVLSSYRRVILEPAGALGVAGLKRYVELHNVIDRNLVAITSGANMDFNRLRFVAERADETECTLAVTIPEQPGSFRSLYSLIWPRNVTEFSYRYEQEGMAHVFLTFHPIVNTNNDFDKLIKTLEKNKFSCLDLRNNELAKVHVRHMAGGRAKLRNERLFRFHFPESPGALYRFLYSLDIFWNISLFHYRNHGDNFGRVLVGIQEGTSYKRLEDFLENLGYQYVEETSNAVYQTFLRNA